MIAIKLLAKNVIFEEKNRWAVHYFKCTALNKWWKFQNTRTPSPPSWRVRMWWNMTGEALNFDAKVVTFIFDRCEFEIGVEADDADVSWYRYQLSYGRMIMRMMRRLTLFWTYYHCDRSEMERRSTWRTGELRLLPMARRGNLFSRLTQIIVMMVIT